MTPPGAYDKYPTIPIHSSAAECAVGWESVLKRLGSNMPRVLCVECYPGVQVEDVEQAMVNAFQSSHLFRSRAALKPAPELELMLSPVLTADPVFGRMNGLGIGNLRC
ncbi:MAG: hypothetical protein ABSF14_09080 [Terriglobia bacterium]|jgi:hypothetical protein